MKHQLYREEQFSCDLQTTWSFFSNPYNLAKITPEDMGFEVVSRPPKDEIFEGLIIDYIVSPILKVPLKWKTRITQVNPMKSFTDFQLKGPYKLWHHEHQFIPNEKGVLMKDKITYELPLGFYRQLGASIFRKIKTKLYF